MATGDPNPTLRQILRAALRIALEALSVPFSRRQAVNFMSAGQIIRGHFYYPKTSPKTPGVLLLHTATGLTPHEHAFAARLAREGYTTLVIAYSKRTTGAVVENELRRKQLEQIVVDAWRFLQQNPRTDPIYTAVIGFSLGGYLATHIATAVKEFAPKAVVVYYGMYALAGSKMMRLDIPLLILQGEHDYGDFVTNAKRVEEIGFRDDKPWEVAWYPESGHQFDLFDPTGAAARDAWERTIRFLREHLEST